MIKVNYMSIELTEMLYKRLLALGRFAKLDLTSSTVYGAEFSYFTWPYNALPGNWPRPGNPPGRVR
jgi:hypothetical protein